MVQISKSQAQLFLDNKITKMDFMVEQIWVLLQFLKPRTFSTVDNFFFQQIVMKMSVYPNFGSIPNILEKLEK